LGTLADFAFDPELNVTVQVVEADDSDDSDTSYADGKVTLDTSLASLRDMGIDTITAAEGSGISSLVISQGFGTTELETLAESGFAFDPELDVTVEVLESDGSATSDVDGTVTLNTSLSSLSAMGIDTVTAAQNSGISSLVISQGFGTTELETLAESGFAFDPELDVTVEVLESDGSATSDADGKVTLDTSLASLSDMGIDTVSTAENSGINSLVISQGFGDIDSNGVIDLSALDGDLDGFNFAEELDVTLAMDVDGTVSLDSSLKDISDLGIDLITGEAGQSLSINGLGFTTIDDLQELGDTNGLKFDAGLDVTLEVATDEMDVLLSLIDPELTSDDLTEANDADVLNSTLEQLGLNDLGIDHILIGGKSASYTDSTWDWNKPST
jgi:DNA/RNA endonuclease YhcR with UshA esterase domain